MVNIKREVINKTITNKISSSNMREGKMSMGSNKGMKNIETNNHNMEIIHNEIVRNQDMATIGIEDDYFAFTT